MFGPVRGAWLDESWRGWWGETPPYHVPVFVLTHHARPPLEMDGGTTFHFVTGGIHERSEEHTSELQSLMRISYAVFCLKKKKRKHNTQHYMLYTMNQRTIM